MKIRWVSLAAALALAALPVSALAGPGNLTLKAGGFVHADSNAGNAGLALGVDDVVRPAGTLQPLAFSLYGDLFQKSVGAGVAIRSIGPAYLGAGIGIYDANVTQNGACPGGVPGGSCSVSFSQTGFGGKIFGGFSVAPHTGLEIAYTKLPAVNGINTNTVSAELTFRL